MHYITTEVIWALVNKDNASTDTYNISVDEAARAVDAQH